MPDQKDVDAALEWASLTRYSKLRAVLNDERESAQRSEGTLDILAAAVRDLREQVATLTRERDTLLKAQQMDLQDFREEHEEVRTLRARLADLERTHAAAVRDLRDRVEGLEGLLRDACIGHEDGLAHWQSCAWCRAVYAAPTVGDEEVTR